jgi:hypothetical protein
VIELELARDPDDRRRHRLGEGGSLRLEGWGGRHLVRALADDASAAAAAAAAGA